MARDKHKQDQLYSIKRIKSNPFHLIKQQLYKFNKKKSHKQKVKKHTTNSSIDKIFYRQIKNFKFKSVYTQKNQLAFYHDDERNYYIIIDIGYLNYTVSIRIKNKNRAQQLNF